MLSLRNIRFYSGDFKSATAEATNASLALEPFAVIETCPSCHKYSSRLQPICSSKYVRSVKSHVSHYLSFLLASVSRCLQAVVSRYKATEICKTFVHLSWFFGIGYRKQTNSNADAIITTSLHRNIWVTQCTYESIALWCCNPKAPSFMSYDFTW